jgi:putative transposase
MELKNPEKRHFSSKHLVYSCQYHVIFCPKYRRDVLKGDVKDRLIEIFENVQEEYDFNIVEQEIMADHVHLIIECNPRFGVMKCIHRLKGRSSNIIRNEFPKVKSRIPSLWTRSAFISSVGSVSLDVVKEYIENQDDV